MHLDHKAAVDSVVIAGTVSSPAWSSWLGDVNQVLTTLTLIVGLASEDEANPETLTNYGFNESFKKPFDEALLAERIRTLVE